MALVKATSKRKKKTAGKIVSATKGKTANLLQQCVYVCRFN